MAFWSTDLQAGTKDPKRKYRFKVIFNGLDANGDGIIWYAKTVKKPSYNITQAEHTFLNHKYYFPGKVEWQESAMTLVDPVSPGAVAQTNAIIRSAGYKVPGSATDLETISKGKFSAALGAVQIIQIDAEGNHIETWSLKNPTIMAVDLGELSYEDDGLVEISLTFRYDWAECDINEGIVGVDGAKLDKIGNGKGSSSEFFKTTGE